MVRIVGTKWAFCCDLSNVFDFSLVLLWMCELSLSHYLYVDAALIRSLATHHVTVREDWVQHRIAQMCHVSCYVMLCHVITSCYVMLMWFFIMCHVLSCVMWFSTSLSYNAYTMLAFVTNPWPQVQYSLALRNSQACKSSSIVETYSDDPRI